MRYFSSLKSKVADSKENTEIKRSAIYLLAINPLWDITNTYKSINHFKQEKFLQTKESRRCNKWYIDKLVSFIKIKKSISLFSIYEIKMNRSFYSYSSSLFSRLLIVWKYKLYKNSAGTSILRNCINFAYISKPYL